MADLKTIDLLNIFGNSVTNNKVNDCDVADNRELLVSTYASFNGRKDLSKEKPKHGFE